MKHPKRPLKVEFEGHAGYRLAGVFHLPDGEAKTAIILSHCFTCSKDYKVIAWLAGELAARGYPVLRFDFSGLGGSEGEFADTTLSTDVQDLLAAVKWVTAQGYVVATLVGHSLGGAASILTAPLVGPVRTVAVLGTSAEVGRVTRMLTDADWDRLEREGVVEVQVGGVLRPIRREFVADLQQHSLRDTVARWDKALLVIHGTADALVSATAQEELFVAARQPKAFLSVPGADHLFAADRRLAGHIARMIEQWVELNGETA